jgi:FkbM family methyltransferase
VFGIANRLDRILTLARSAQARHLRRRGIEVETFRRYNLRWLRNRSIRSLIDVGANCGQFSLVMHEVLPTARIVAFEPLADCFQELKRRLAHVDGLVPLNVAVGEGAGAIEFHRSSYSQSSSVRPMTAHRELFPDTARCNSLSVECVTLDAAVADLGLQDEILIKMDVQGFEDKVIAGGLQTIRRASVLWVETSFVELYQGQPLFADIHDRLRELGFQYHGSHAQLPSPRDDSILQADSIFVRDGLHSSA